MSHTNSMIVRRRRRGKAKSQVSRAKPVLEDTQDPPPVSLATLRLAFSTVEVEISTSDSRLSRYCYAGNLKGVRKMVRTRPAIIAEYDSTLPGYISQVVLGAQKDDYTVDPAYVQREELVQYLCDVGCAVDDVDMVDCTAFIHCFWFKPQLSLAKILLDNGANINHRTFHGFTPISIALNVGHTESIQFLLHHGVNLDLGGVSIPSRLTFSSESGSKIEMVALNCKLEGKGKGWGPEAKIPCTMCGEEELKLQYCGRCRLVQYCSKVCQRAHWKTHKDTCFDSLEQTVVVVKPDYSHRFEFHPTAYMRDMILHGTSSPDIVRQVKTSPRDHVTPGTNMVLRIQVNESGSFISVFDRHLNFACRICEVDNHTQYAVLLELITRKGFPASPGGPGIRMYLLADLKNRDELVLKLGQVLEEQPF